MKPKFKIGQKVLVNLADKIVPKYVDNYREMVRENIHDREVLGRITGVKIFQEGEVVSGQVFNTYNYESYDPPYLNVKETITTYAVRLGYKNKEIYFLPEDINLTETDKDIPYLYSGWTEEERKWMSDQSKDWPRDSKGRFI